jgi:phosphoserine phosphatase RsbX
MDPLTSTAGNALLEWGMAGEPLAGQSESGDLGLVLPFPGGILVGALDGLGHGDEAAAAARAAAEVLRSQPDAPVIWLVRECHAALGETRGVVMSLASFSARYATMTWIGIGNVEGLLVRADAAASPPRETLLLRGGVVGFKLPELGAAVLPVGRGDTLVLATDGIRNDFADGLSLAHPAQQVADQILARHAKKTDDALALVAVVVGDTA